MKKTGLSSNRRAVNHCLGNHLVMTVVAVIVVLFLSQDFMRNFFQLGRPEIFPNFQMDSEQSVRLMVQKTALDGQWSTGGFMLQRELNGRPYLSAWGLQGKFFSLLYAVVGGNLEGFFELGHVLMSLALAVTLTVLGLFCWREWGVGSALALWLLCSLSDWLVFAGRNMMLVYWAHLLPFVLSLLLFPQSRYENKAVLWRYFVFVGLAVLGKSLCYLDYSSNIVLSVAIGPIYFGIKNQVPWKVLAQWVVAIVVISAVAVLVAIIATGVQAAFYLGSWSEGFNQLLATASSRMYGSTNVSQAADANISTFQILDSYLTLPVLSLPFEPGRYRIYLSFFAAISLWLPLFLCSLLDRDICPAFAWQRRWLFGLGVATFWGLLATISWGFLMKGHMFHHIHLNGLIFYLPYMLMIYIFLGAILARVVEQLRLWLGDHLS